MTDTRLRLAIAVLAAAGAGISAYLLAARGTPICSTGGCEQVQTSSYAHLLGIPLAALGLAAYLTLLASALSRSQAALAVGAVVARPRSPSASTCSSSSSRSSAPSASGA